MSPFTAVVAVTVALLSSATPALAGAVGVVVPEPGTLALLSSGAALVVLGARWIRRK